jgi:DUF4097 and DUF4098 domain-containing protein YvlB
MRNATIAIALTVCALGASSAQAQNDTERVNRVLRLDPGGTLRLKTFSGHVTITGSDRPDVVIDAVRRAPRERLDRIKLDIRAEGSTIVVDANQHDRSDRNENNNVVETDFDIKVPARTNLDVNAFSSPIDVSGVEGTHNVHTFSSRVKLDDVTGPVDAHTFSGDVEIRTRTWQDRQTIDVDTFSGSIRLRVPDSARGRVRFNSFSGRLTSDMPLTLRSSSRRSFDATLGGGDSSGGSISLKTFSGDARIER